MKRFLRNNPKPHLADGYQLHLEIQDVLDLLPDRLKL